MGAGPAQPARRSARQAAFDLLARREYSAAELASRLEARGYEPQEVRTVVDGLRREGLQCDERFAEAFVRSRTSRGQGPLRIAAELRSRGIDESLLSAMLDDPAAAWIERARRVRERRFGAASPRDQREKARQARFLAQRGFTGEQVYAALARFASEEEY
ncbi:MAG: regulatory protein RecX [Chromatiales bacterium]|nr:regulatory protein RecX [Chromatiales bacterium]